MALQTGIEVVGTDSIITEPSGAEPEQQLYYERVTDPFKLSIGQLVVLQWETPKRMTESDLIYCGNGDRGQFSFPRNFNTDVMVPREYAGILKNFIASTEEEALGLRPSYGLHISNPAKHDIIILTKNLEDYTILATSPYPHLALVPQTNPA